MPGGAMFIALPGAAAVFGLVEGMTGRAFSELDAAWSALPLTNRFCLGSMLVLGGGAIAFAIVGMWLA